MESIVFTSGLIVINLVWMLFYYLALPEEKQKRTSVTIQKILPKIKTKKQKEEDLEEEFLKGMDELTSVPLDTIKKGMLQSK